MKAADVMTVGAATVQPDTPVSEAAEIMLQYRISGLPVVDTGGKLVGIVTESDFIRRAEVGTQRRHSRWASLLLDPGARADDYIRAHARKVSEVMTSDVATVDAETPLSDVVDLMEDRGFKRVPVLRDGRVVGIISRANLLRALVQPSDPALPGAISDAVIRDRIIGEIEKQDWAPQNAISVSVRNGGVSLKGTVLDERIRTGLSVIAEGVPGVQSVKNEIEVATPVPGWL